MRGKLGVLRFVSKYIAAVFSARIVAPNIDQRVINHENLPKHCLSIVVGGGGVAAQINISPESRCSPYSRSDYFYPQSIELEIISQNLDGKITSPYTGEVFPSRKQTDIEHIVATSEAHDSGLCAASAARKKIFARDLDNLTLASPSVNRYQKRDKDLSEWLPPQNQCWYVNTVVNVKAKYGLSMDSQEADVAITTLKVCNPKPACYKTSQADTLNCYAESGQSAMLSSASALNDGCFSRDSAYVISDMNIREEPSVSSALLGRALVGTYPVEGSAQGDDYCWIDIGRGWIARTSRVSATEPVGQPADQPAARSSQPQSQHDATTSQPASEQATQSPPAQSALQLYDDNGNGRITCAEARNHGIAPVRRGHPAYQYMNDRDHDGTVCE